MEILQIHVVRALLKFLHQFEELGRGVHESRLHCRLLGSGALRLATKECLEIANLIQFLI